MHELFQALESNGIVSELDMPKVYDFPNKKVVALYEKVYSTVFNIQAAQADSDEDPPSDTDPFSFMAGASIRADSGCSELVCRMRKLDFLARFSALYANHVTLPLSLESPDKVKKIARLRDYLFRNLTSIFALRSLIENEIVAPVIMRTGHCEHVKEFVNEMIGFVHDVADWEAKDAMGDFKVEYQRPEQSPSGRSTAYIEGPEEFLEHGNLVMLFDEGSSWRAKSWKYDAEGKTVLKGKKKLLFIRQVFNTIANDTTFYLASGQQHRARLLTDRAGDAFLLNLLNQDEQLQATTAAMEFLTHSIPILADIPLSTVIRIRREDRESFRLYRRAIDALTAEVLAESGGLTVKEAREAFKTKLEPQIEKMKIEVNAERKRQSKRFSRGISSLAAAVMIGACGGLPILIKGALAAAATGVGGTLLGRAAVSECEHGADIRQKNDLYFVLRLIEE